MAARALCVAQGGGLHAGRPKQPGAPQPARQVSVAARAATHRSLRSARRLAACLHARI